MKKIPFAVMLIVAMISFTPVAEIYAQPVSVSVNFSTFQQELSPYGRWMNNPRFGQVWINNDAGFKPYYTAGHWEYTNYGWSWESDYDWGWAPFHYGRWEYDPYYGWMWIPGYEWASAWVSWSSYDDYYGWAPLGYGININVSFGSIPFNNWNFVPRRNICERNLSRYYFSYQQHDRFRNAVIINNYYYGNGGVGRYVRGPQRREVERYTNTRIPERNIVYTDRNRNRNNRIVTADDYNRSGNRNNDAVNPDNNIQRNENNRRSRDVNANTDAAIGQPDENNRQRNDVNRSGGGSQNNNPQNSNERRRKDIQPDNNNLPAPVLENRKPPREGMNLPQSNENNNRNREMKPDNNPAGQPVYENRRPQREINTMPPVNDNNKRYSRETENRINSNAPQQNSVPPRAQQRIETRQQNAPVMEQRSNERRADRDNGGNLQRMNGNIQPQNRENGRKRNGY